MRAWVAWWVWVWWSTHGAVVAGTHDPRLCARHCCARLVVRLRARHTPRAAPAAGALLLGDAFNMRHPLTGGGMTVALSDTRLLCEMLQPLPSFQDAIATARSTAEFYTKRKPVSATINTLANALYKVCEPSGVHARELQARAAPHRVRARVGVWSGGAHACTPHTAPAPRHTNPHTCARRTRVHRCFV